MQHALTKISIPAKLVRYATAFSKYAPLNVLPWKSASFMSADVKLPRLKFSLGCEVFLHSFTRNEHFYIVIIELGVDISEEVR